MSYLQNLDVAMLWADKIPKNLRKGQSNYVFASSLLSDFMTSNLWS